MEVDRSLENRTKLKKIEAELKRYLKIEEEYWRQKAGMKRFIQGDKNNKFFSLLCSRKEKKIVSE